MGGAAIDKRFFELLGWCKKFQNAGLIPDPKIKKGGNLSFRDGDGFVITPSAKPFVSLLAEDLVKVEKPDYEKNIVYARGRLFPASETFIHAMIYENYPVVNAVFHGECELITKNAEKLGLAVTEQFHQYGTLDLAKETLKSFFSNPNAQCIVMRDHGEVYVGKDMQDAGETALHILEMAKRNAGE
ncbi:MAG: class II aldolase/adducin family protein [Candidatus Aenigmatarchaeota archaeon]